MYGVEFGLAEVELVEREVQALVDSSLPVARANHPSSVLGQEEVVTVPGTLYPATLTLVTVDGHKEPCCGTHLLNSADVETLLVTGLRTPSTGMRSLRCLTGPPALSAMHSAVELGLAVTQLGEVVEARVEEGGAEDMAELARELEVLRAKVAEPDFPLVMGAALSESLEAYQARVTAGLRKRQAAGAQDQMVAALAEQEGRPFFLHSLALEPGTRFSLAKAAKLVARERPSLILSVQGREVKGKAVVPPSLVTASFTAELWLAEAASRIGAEVAPPRSQAAELHCNMAAARLVPSEVDETVRRMLEHCRRYGEKHLQLSSSHCASGEK